jgi:hypothetical protein
MDYIDVFNATVDELVHDEPDTHASKTIRKLLSARRTNSYFVCMQPFFARHGLKFFVKPYEEDHVPCIEYLEDNAFEEKPQVKHLRNIATAHDYCFFIIAKELMEVLNEHEEVV